MEILLKYFDDLDSQRLSQFKMLEPLYIEWNEKINVISRKDIQFLYERHILHSLTIAKLVRFKPQTSILDVGTGGGFPGIPLAIMFPQVKFHLIDSVGKKIKVVNAVVEALGLPNVTANHMRVQDVKTKFDFVVSRAVTNLPDFVNITQNLISPKGFNMLNNGILYLKGGEFNDELKLLKAQLTTFNLSDYFNEEFFETKKLVHIYRCI
ncbi:MAG: 16S rRNA (guanine(527)-N(7))-methyltransferase RsmG [Bacteroidetes bacterium]|nr:16S rRNA (guanine(527)-N(7))-methyltransferase RsmG [Bacteroidota bacterium]